MTSLFKNKPLEQLRSKRLIVWLTEIERDEIRHNAKIRQLEVSEFVRRAVSARKANVNYEAQQVLALADVTRRIRELHAAVVATGTLPPEEKWGPVIDDVRAAIARLVV